jgi:uncharacterized protein
MKTAAELLREYIVGPHMPLDEIVTMFAEDGVLEAPYFASFGLTWRFEGHQALRGTYLQFFELYRELRFENPRLICENPEVAVGEYEFIARSMKTGRKVHQLSIVTIVAKNGKIKLLREFQNIAEIALAIFPNGLAALRIPDERCLKIGEYASQI